MPTFETPDLAEVIHELRDRLTESDGLLAFIRRESTLSPRRTLLIATVAGISNALILAIVNSAAEHAGEGTSKPLYAAAFVAVMAFYVISQRWMLTQVAEQIEAIIHRVRMRIMEAVKDCDFIDVEGIGRSAIYNSVSVHTQTLSQASSSLTIALQMIILVAFTALYLGYVSFISLIAMAVSMTVILTIYFRKAFSVRNDLISNLALENDVQMSIKDLLDGLREAKLSRRKTQAILQRIQDISQVTSEKRSVTQVLMAQNFVFSQVAFYLLLGIMVFVVPQLTETYGDVVGKSTTTVLFLIGPISGVVGAIPVFENASAAAKAISDLEAQLKSMASPGVASEPDAAHSVRDDPPAFDVIELRQACFRFPGSEDADGFGIGPLDLTIKRGACHFITGGNGSGKSTLLHAMLGLYPLQSGEILWNGQKVTPARIQSYREMFATVLADFHLSRHLDGADPRMMDEAQHWLEVLELGAKAQIADGTFSTIDLSAGQRKRLALVNAVLDGRPILVLDEWAADQDPIFRKKFYREILPMLLDRGHTIIAVTHDSRFFDAATQRSHMEDGMMADLESLEDFDV